MQTFRPSILCTGPVDESILRSPEFENADIDVIPLTHISTALNKETCQQVETILSKKTSVVFTSNNAVRSVADHMTVQPMGWTIYCIGNTTYALAKKYFGEKNIKETASTASRLAQKIIPVIDDSEITFFCGNLRRNDLPEALRKKGIAVKEIIVYHTSLAPQAISKEYDAILFFSPSAAESFFTRNRLAAKTISFVMGKTTEDAIRKFSGNLVVTGSEPDKKKLIQAAIDHILQNQTEFKKSS